MSTKSYRPQNQLLLASAPATPIPGDSYYDTALKAYRIWDGSAWQTSGGGSSTGSTSATAPLGYVYATNTTAQSLPNSTNPVITGWTVSTNIGGAVTYDSTNSRFVFSRAGRYQITATITYVANGSGGRLADIVLNGTIIAREYAAPGAADATACAVTITVNVNANDYIDVRGYQSSGGSLSLSSIGVANLVTIAELAAGSSSEQLLYNASGGAGTGSFWAASGYVSTTAGSFTRVRRVGSLVHVHFFWSANAGNGGTRWFIGGNILPPVALPSGAGSSNYYPVGSVSFYNGSDYVPYHVMWKPDEQLFFFGSIQIGATAVPQSAAVYAGYTVDGSFTYQTV